MEYCQQDCFTTHNNHNEFDYYWLLTMLAMVIPCIRSDLYIGRLWSFPISGVICTSGSYSGSVYQK